MYKVDVDLHIVTSSYMIVVFFTLILLLNCITLLDLYNKYFSLAVLLLLFGKIMSAVTVD